jgi:long-chain acyl-CoA synthetase
MSTLIHRLLDRAEATPDAVALAVLPRGATQLAPAITWRAWRDGARDVALALLARDLPVGGTVLVFADNRPLWPIVDVAVGMVRGVTVGAFPTAAPAQVMALLRDAGARVVFTDRPDRLAAVLAARAQVPWPVDVVVDGRFDASAADAVWSLEAFTALVGAREVAARQAQLAQRLLALCPDDAAALVYTSGSTGEPKGARLTHRYHVASAESIAAVLGLTAQDRGVAFLPFCHAAERVFGHATRLLVGMSAVLVESPDDVWQAARVFAPTLFGGLPRLFEKLVDAIPHDADGPAAAAVIRAMLGGAVRLATSGGAALPARVVARLEGAGLPVLGAYGQTEHLCIAMNRPGAHRHDVVGPPMPGTTVRLDDTGELLVARGPLTFSGYHGRPEATREAFTADGVWLRTGDLATQDADGALRIVGRRKDVLALSTGKKVAPQPIEAALMASPLVAAAACHGEGRRFLAAVLLLDREAVLSWAHEAGEPAVWPRIAQSAALRAVLQAHVDAVNAERSRPEQVRAFVLGTDSLDAMPEAITPTHKVRREAVLRHHARALDALYASTISGGAAE